MRFTAQIALVLTLVASAPSARAQQVPGLPGRTGAKAPASASSSAPEVPLEQQLADRRTGAAEELEQLRSRRQALAENLAPGVARELEKQESLLVRLQSVLGRRLAELQRAQALEREVDSVANERAALRSQASPGAASLVELDGVLSSVAAQKARADATARALDAARSAVERARTAVDEATSARARARQALDEAGDEARRAVLEAELATARLEERVRRASLELHQQELERHRLSHRIAEARVELLDERREDLRQRVAFTPRQLEEKLAELEETAAGLSAEIESAESELGRVESRWQEAQRRAEEPGSSPTTLAEEKALRQQLELLRLRARVAAERRDRLEVRRIAWRRRQAVLSAAADPADLPGWRSEAERELELLDGQEAVLSAELAARRQQREGAARAVSELEEAPGTPRAALAAARRARDAVDAIVQLTEDELSALEETRALVRALLREVEDTEERESFLEAAWSRLRAATRAAWDFEIATLDERVITVNGVAKGLLLLVVGLLLVRLLAKLFGEVLEHRVKLEEGPASTLESLAFYATAFLVGLFALHVANIPLTAFTLLGGALAIGIGFGTQNILNNFISGLILLVERPVRVGDLIEVRGETMGIIRRIGARSTKVRTGEGVDILVPNSSFLENQVVNWTLGDNRVRTAVEVGVAYGSPTREVARQLRQAAEEHGLVLDKPEPFVLFDDFGDSSLVFQVHFWVRVRRPMDQRKVQSDLRFMIDNHLREAGITIAFPQRDVHFDAVTPVPVRLVKDEAGGVGEDEEVEEARPAAREQGKLPE